MARWIAIVVLIAMCAAPAPSRAQGGQKLQKSPLSGELEGLDPAARVAYLEYLLLTRSADPEVFFQLGVAFQDEAKPDSAIYYYTKATELAPTLSKAYVNMGVVLDDQRKHADALAAFEKGAEVNPGDLLAHSHAAYMLFEEGDYDKGWSHLSKALEIDSLNAQPHFYLAIFFWECGMYREALNEWEKVTKLAPDSYLAKKAEENINVLQEALTAPAGRGGKIEKQ
jgi:tetratricopeptide (TPR) repeat protein